MARLFALVFCAALLTGCVTDSGPKQIGGTLLGAIGGAAAGAQFGQGTGQLVSVAAGTLLGSFIGSSVGASLDAADRAAMAQTTQSALETAPAGTRSVWQNPDTGNSGIVMPTRTYAGQDGRFCREYQQTVVIGGQTQDAYGTACRQADGTWALSR